MIAAEEDWKRISKSLGWGPVRDGWIDLLIDGDGDCGYGEAPERPARSVRILRGYGGLR